MRLWSLHPSYLDPKGLVALWREALLAQRVLAGETVGYHHHPQLIRFKDTKNPKGAIATYLRYVVAEADHRGYHFDRAKIKDRRLKGQINVTNGQLEYELAHLLKKLKVRDPRRYANLRGIGNIDVHPLFLRVSGDMAPWERV